MIMMVSDNSVITLIKSYSTCKFASCSLLALQAQQSATPMYSTQSENLTKTENNKIVI